MRCDECRNLLSEYIDESLDESTVVDLEAHIGGCSQCADILSEYRQMLGIVAEMRPEVPSISDEVMKRISEETGAQKKRTSRIIARIATVAAVLVFGVYALFNPATEPPQQPLPITAETEGAGNQVRGIALFSTLSYNLSKENSEKLKEQLTESGTELTILPEGFSFILTEINKDIFNLFEPSSIDLQSEIHITIEQ